MALALACAAVRGADALVHCCTGDSLHMWDPSGRLLQSSGAGTSDKLLPDASGIARSYTHAGTSLPARFADQFAPWSVFGELHALCDPVTGRSCPPNSRLRCNLATCCCSSLHHVFSPQQKAQTGAAGDDVNTSVGATLIRLALRTPAGEDAADGVDLAAGGLAKVCSKAPRTRAHY